MLGPAPVRDPAAGDPRRPGALDHRQRPLEPVQLGRPGRAPGPAPAREGGRPAAHRPAGGGRHPPGHPGPLGREGPAPAAQGLAHPPGAPLGRRQGPARRAPDGALAARGQALVPLRRPALALQRQHLDPLDPGRGPVAAGGHRPRDALRPAAAAHGPAAPGKEGRGPGARGPGRWTRPSGSRCPRTPRAWPPYDPAWTWWSPDQAATAWDARWGKPSPLPKERQREALLRANRPDWITASGLRASVRGWLPSGPEVALREASAVAWVWVGDRALLERLQPTGRLTAVAKGP